MRATRTAQLGRIAVALAIVGGIVAIFRVWLAYRRAGTVDWGHLALAMGVPCLIYVMMRGVEARDGPPESS